MNNLNDLIYHNATFSDQESEKGADHDEDSTVLFPFSKFPVANRWHTLSPSPPEVEQLFCTIKLRQVCSAPTIGRM